jgi:PAS domain S-box-containing protein
MRRFVLPRWTLYVAAAAVLFAADLPLRRIHWQGGVQLHTLMEAAATLLALAVGKLALVRFYSRKDNTFLFVGTGFLGAGLLDGYAVVTSTFFTFSSPSPPSSMTPSIWLASSVFLSVLLWLSWIFWRREDRLGEAGRIREAWVYLLVGLWTAACFLFFLKAPPPAGSEPLPFLHHPQELIPACFSLLALIGYLRKGRWRNDPFEHWLVLSLLVSFLGQALFLSTSHALYDPLFEAAYVLRMISYVCMLVGLLISMHHLLVWDEQLISERTLALRQEIAERARATEALRASEVQLRTLVERTSDWLWETDADIRFTYSNPKVKQLLDYEPEEVLGKTPADMVIAPERPIVEAFNARLKIAPQPLSGFVAHCVAADGHEVILEIGSEPIFEAGHFCGMRGIARDVTARQHAEEAVRLSEEKFRSLLANIPDVAWTLDATMRFQYISPNIERLSGYSPDEITRSGARFFLDHIHPEDAERVGQALHALFARGEPYDVECRIRAKDGEWRWIHDRALVTYGRDGVRCADGLLSDITERKRAEQSLQRTEAELREALSAAQMGAWTWTQATGVITWDENLHLILGRDPKQPDTNLDELPHFFTAESWQRLAAAIDRAVATGNPYELDLETLRPDGSKRCVIARGGPLRDSNGQMIGLRGTAQDITERKRAEEALRKSEQRARLISESIDDVFWMADTTIDQMVYVSPAYERIWGRSRESLYQDPKSFLEAVHPQDRPRVLSDLQREKSGLPFDHEYRILRPDGSLAWIWDRGFPVRDAHHRVELYVGLAQDITERKRAAAELERAKEVAEAASRAKSEFLANMSHEIRTPMNGILGMTELALTTRLTPEQGEYLEMIKSSADSLLVVINDILDVSKIEAGKLDLELREFNLEEILGSALKVLGLQANSKGLELNLYMQPGMPELVVADADRLRQIVINLVGNAIKFTERGKVTVRVGCDPGKAGTICLRFSVQDTGIGIPVEKQRTIFDAFSQADASVTRRYGGTGLGLTISRRLVEMMGGRIWLESVPGEGSTFQFTVPLCVKQSNGQGPLPAQPHGSESSLPCRSLDILLAEDNLINQKVISRLLEKHGHRVQIAGNGRAALDKLSSASFDLVLMDVQMPEMDGLEATRAIRKVERHAGGHVPIIALTAHALKTDYQRCLDVGMDGYLSKPIRPDDLFRQIEQICSASGGVPEQEALSPG